MKKYVLLAAMAVTIAAPGLALAQNAQPGVANAPPPRQPGQQFQPQPGQMPDFATHKAEVLARMNEHLADLPKRISCVQAAQDDQALRACLPPPPMMGHRQGMGPMGAPGMAQPGIPNGGGAISTGKK